MRILVVLFLVAVPFWGSGRTVEAATGLSVSVGYGGFAQPGRAYPVDVEVTTDELFVGDLRITSSGGAFGTTRPVEFAGGTVNEITVVIAPSPFESGEIEVALVAGNGDIVESSKVRIRQPSNTDLVGVFPDVAGRDLPEKVSTIADSGEAQLFPIDPASLDSGLGVLGPIDILVADADDLRALTSTHMGLVMAWVSSGGRLLVDEPTSSEVPGLPAAWQPDGPMPHRAGIGEVVLTNGAAQAGDWSSILEPAPTRSRQEDESLGDMAGFFGGEPLSWSLGRDAGFSLPGIRTMIAMLVGYVVVVGPGCWLALRVARRPGLSWIIVPVMAVGATGIIWVAGSAYRDGVSTAHGTIIQVAPGGSVASTYELLNSRRGGIESIELPNEWSSIGSSQEGPTGVIEIADVADGERVSTDVDAGGFVVLGGTGVLADYDDSIEVSATSGGPGEVSGTFTNRLDVDLHDVGAFADSAGVNIGDVAAGTTVEFAISGAPTNPVNGEPVEFKVWRDAIPPEWTGDFDRPFAPGPINLSLWSEVSARSGINARQVGEVVIAGWTDELASPIDPAVVLGRTLLMTTGQIEPEGDALSDVAVQRTVVRGPSEVGSNFRMNDGWGGGVMVRYLVPDSGPGTDDLVLQIPRSQRRVEVFVNDSWQRVDVEADQNGVFRLPGGAVNDGRVYIKVLLDFERNANWRDLAVRSSTDDDDVRRMRLLPTGATG